MTDAHVAVLTAATPAALAAALADSAVNLAVHHRPAAPWLEAVRDLTTRIRTPYQFWSVRDDIGTLHDRLRTSALALLTGAVSERRPGDADAVEALFADVVDLAELLAETCGDRRPFVSLRSIDASYFTPGRSSVSSHLHVDTATATLTCTYVGRGTEWTPDDNVIRDALADRKMQRPDEPETALVHDPELFHRFGTFDVTVLKGEIRRREDQGSRDFLANFLTANELEPYNEGAGLLHRGPGHHHGTRLLLTVSTMRVPAFARAGHTRHEPADHA